MGTCSLAPTVRCSSLMPHLRQSPLPAVCTVQNASVLCIGACACRKRAVWFSHVPRQLGCRAAVPVHHVQPAADDSVPAALAPVVLGVPRHAPGGVRVRYSAPAHIASTRLSAVGFRAVMHMPWQPRRRSFNASVRCDALPAPHRWATRG